jgi:hypothetical protein
MKRIKYFEVTTLVTVGFLIKKIFVAVDQEHAKKRARADAESYSALILAMSSEAIPLAASVERVTPKKPNAKEKRHAQ